MKKLIFLLAATYNLNMIVIHVFHTKLVYALPVVIMFMIIKRRFTTGQLLLVDCLSILIHLVLFSIYPPGVICGCAFGVELEHVRTHFQHEYPNIYKRIAKMNRQFTPWLLLFIASI